MKIRFILSLLLILMIISLPVGASNTEIYLRTVTSHYRAIFFSSIIQSKYIHAGLKVGKWAISAGPNGIDLKLANFKNAIYIDTGKSSDLWETYRRAVNLFEQRGFASYIDYIKVFLNIKFGIDYRTDGMTCSAFVARMLDMENPQNKIPSDFLKLKGDKNEGKL